MIGEHVQAIILAAGNSSRLKTGKNKLLEKICGQPLILYPISIMQKLALPITMVAADQKELLQKNINQIAGDSSNYVVQESGHGTANAVIATRDLWYKDHILIMHGDLPLVTPDLLQQLYNTHVQADAAVTFIIAHNADPELNGYDRVVQKEKTMEIVPTSNAESHEDCCVNAGIYLVKKHFLESAIDHLATTTDLECSFAEIIHYAYQKEQTVCTINASFDEIRGVNTLQDLWEAEHIKKSELIKRWMEHGVYFSAPHLVHIDSDVEIGSGSSIGAGVHLIGKTIIGSNTRIQEFSIIENSIIGDETVIYSHSVVKDACIGSNVKVGPFAHIKEQSTIGNHSIIGNYVEIKKSSIDEHSKAKHLSYIGDAHIGSHVNIGAGTITCNHNGVNKNKTIIENNAYVGANNTLVAPITIGSKSFTAAGSVLTQDVPENALAIGRSRQINKDGYAQKMRDQKSKTGEDPQSSLVAFGGAIKTNNDTPQSS